MPSFASVFQAQHHRVSMATKNEGGEYMETVIKLRDFLFDYSWLFNFSNIDMIKLDLVKTVSTFNSIGQRLIPNNIILIFTANFFQLFVIFQYRHCLKTGTSIFQNFHQSQS